MIHYALYSIYLVMIKNISYVCKYTDVVFIDIMCVSDTHMAKYDDNILTLCY